MAEKLSRKELRQPDEFQVVAGRAMEWIVARQKPILIGLGALAIAGAAAWGLDAARRSREQRAGAALDEAIAIETRPIAGEGYAPPAMETFATREERTRAAIAALEKVRSDAPSTRAARTALAELGFVKLKGGDAAGAAQALSDYLDRAGKGEALRPFAVESLGYAFEAQGKLDEARAAFARLAEEGAPQRAALQQARISLLQGKPEAKQLLEQVAKDYPKDPVALEAQQRVELASLPPPSAAPPAPSAAKGRPAQKPVAKKK